MLRFSRSCSRMLVSKRLTSQLRCVSQTAFLRKPSGNIDGLSGATGREDIGFLKSSSVSMSPHFGPFDHSHAVVSAAESRDIMNLWSLLEACLHSGYMERAFSILKSLYALKSHQAYFIDDYNKFLMKYAETLHDIKDLDKKLFHDIQETFPACEYNDKTLAILIHHALKLSSSAEAKLEHCKIYFKMAVSGQRSILSNVDVLTVPNYKSLVHDLKLVSLNELPAAVRPLIESGNIVTGEMLSSQQSSEINAKALSHGEVALDRNIEPLDKDAKELLAVDTIGMKVVRHTLLGLSFTEDQKKQITSFNFDTSSNLLNFDQEKESIDFFEMFRNLKSEEERRSFESALDEFNQDRQHQLENRATDAAKERWRHDFEEAKSRGDLSIQKKLNIKLWEWFNLMLPLVKEEVRRCAAVANKTAQDTSLSPQEKKQNKARQEYGPYLTLVDPEKMCVITILELLKLNSTGGIIEGMRTARAVISVGKAIEMEFRAEMLLKNESHVFKDVNKKSHEFKLMVQRARATFRSIKIEESKVLWPQEARAKIGSILISMLIHVAKVKVEGVDPVTNEKIKGEAPAFSHGYQYHNGSKLGVLKIHRSLIHQLNGERLVAAVQPQLLPMLVKPRAWNSWNSGGYYYTQSTLIRSKDSPEQVAYLKAVSDAGAIDNVYRGLNVLGETPWTVNRKMFNVMSQVWNSGKPFLDIPGIQEKLTLTPQPPRDADPSVHREWKLKNKELANEFSGNRSARCDANYKLEIARAFLGEKFYFPHNLDFRGRAYPLSPHFNHLGNDMSRGLMTFWHGKRLGSTGLRWLKVHLSNLFGFDKAPLEDRVRFAEDHIDDIRDSAEHPLDGKCWWKEADKPWQALATCMELNEALKMSNPDDFVSHQPVHQDGTCNGLQHYAALGGDIEGATQVNLVPSDRPQDVYSHVAKLVVARLEKAAANGDETAALLKDKIKRKVVKQTVMTNVYGVTYIGATHQIDKQLSTLFNDHKRSYELSKYLTKHVFASVRELFEGAHLIQDWLGECAKRISKSIRLDVDEKTLKNGNKPDFMSSVIWTTPLGLPIVQPYRENGKKQVATNLQTVFISDPFAINPINARRQKAGFPPNFIHSLDASHMLLSAAKCGEKGLDFAAVHDSYWTHACDVDTMNVVLREQFIKLHEVDLIERLKDEFDERYKNYLQILKIDKKSEVAMKVTDLKKKLSQKLGRPFTLADEIYMEKKRIQLLSSEDASEQAEGANMVTTVSLVAGAGDISNLEKTSDASCLVVLAPLTLPQIPPKGDFDVRELEKSKYFFS
ncbi:DNA-directed RNA polymerase [Lachancea thermotolerans CBS 6340]|uniref:DNA-directed RNA polymerase n=1 Tax=Lachancea thermotolerans (strain ATCC 56472 / CBS 6340 / NRRL Y-8284) TaxID=559295 RepID=C5DNP3_LACTC|nr:KLTH0G18744p [Lachancea thermotolerans CBS 6340]CAR25404.1 KLTH0G18744p [Lachancea thermotolerans CBS 6340]